MNNFFQRSALLTVLLLSSATIQAEPASPKSIKALLQSSGSGEMGMQMMAQMLPALKNMIPDAPESFWTDVMAELNIDDIENMVIPVYQKYLTETDIQAIDAFYQTEVGAKLIRVQPAIMQESMQIGQQWGQNIAREIMLKYQAKNSTKP